MNRFTRAVIVVVGAILTFLWLFFGLKGVAWVQVLPLIVLLGGLAVVMLVVGIREILRWVWNG